MESNVTGHAFLLKAVPLLSPSDVHEYEIPFEYFTLQFYKEHHEEHYGKTIEHFCPYYMCDGDSGKHKSQTFSSPGRVRKWKKYAKSKNLTHKEMDMKRLSANEMERRRMNRINQALDMLREKLHKCNFMDSHAQHPHRKLSKIKTLKLAIDYIQRLEEMLKS